MSVYNWFQALPGRIGRRLLESYRYYFCQWNYIFEHSGPFPPEAREDCIFLAFDANRPIPDAIAASMVEAGGVDRLETDRLEINENATMWVAVVGDQVASTVFTRRGRHFRRWFLPLEESDVVVFRLRTHAEFRGRGIAPSLIRHCLSQQSPPVGKAYIDCRVYNRPSIRCIEKCGFVRVATMKTIRREWALHE